MTPHGTDEIASLLSGLPVGLIARICIVGMFPFSAMDKIFNRGEALLQARSSIVPAPLAPLLLAMGMALEIIGSACVISGWMAGPAALLMAVYCVVTALMFHPFWKRGDLLRPGPSIDRAHFWDFTKNFGLAGGMLLVAVGAGFPT